MISGAMVELCVQGTKVLEMVICAVLGTECDQKAHNDEVVHEMI